MSSFGNYFKSALGGAASGAGIGSAFGPLGMGIGALGGAGVGLLGNYFSEQGADEQKAGLDDIAAKLRAMSDEKRNINMQSLNRVQGYYAPAHKAFEYLYGAGSAPAPAPVTNPMGTPANPPVRGR